MWTCEHVGGGARKGKTYLHSHWLARLTHTIHTYYTYKHIMTHIHMASKATPTPPCPHLPLPSASGQQQIGTALKAELSYESHIFSNSFPPPFPPKDPIPPKVKTFQCFHNSSLHCSAVGYLWASRFSGSVHKEFNSTARHDSNTCIGVVKEQCYFMALCFKLLFGSRELPYNYLSPILSLEELLLELLELWSCSAAWRVFLGIEVWECGDAKSVQYVQVSLLWVVRGYG